MLMYSYYYVPFCLLFHCVVLCVNVYCTAATGCQTNCSQQILVYQININIFTQTEYARETFYTRNIVNDKHINIDDITLYTVWLHCCSGFLTVLSKSKEINCKTDVTFKCLPSRLYSRRHTLRGAGCRLKADVIAIQRLIIAQLHSCTVVLLCTNEHWPSGTVLILNCTVRYLTVLMWQTNCDTAHSNWTD